MATIEVRNDRLIVYVTGIDVVLAMKMSIEIPLEHVLGVRTDAPEADFDTSVTDPSVGTGTLLRGRLAVGTVALADGLAFYDVRDKSNTIAIDLRHEKYQHLVVELEDETPTVAAQRIEAELSRFHARQAQKAGTAGA